MRKEEASGFSCVLVGTYRTENADWIRREKLYNLPLDESTDPSVYRRFTAVVLYAGDAAPLAYAAKADCGVARVSGHRSPIGLCQNCAYAASAFH